MNNYVIENSESCMVNRSGRVPLFIFGIIFLLISFYAFSNVVRLIHINVFIGVFVLLIGFIPLGVGLLFINGPDITVVDRARWIVVVQYGQIVPLKIMTTSLNDIEGVVLRKKVFRGRRGDSDYYAVSLKRKGGGKDIDFKVDLRKYNDALEVAKKLADFIRMELRDEYKI